MTNIEHRIQKLNQVIQPLGESRPDWSIFEDIAKAMGRSNGVFQGRGYIPGHNRDNTILQRLEIDGSSIGREH